MTRITMGKKLRLSPAHWGIFIFIIAQIITFFVLPRVNLLLQSSHIYIPPQPPESIPLWPQPISPAPPGEVPAPAVGSLGPILLYFSTAVIVLGVTLALIPISALRLLLRILFTFLFSWGIFIILILWFPPVIALLVSVSVGFTWFFTPRVWLHNFLMILAMVSLGTIFGRLISPWTAMVLILALAVYDIVAVRFGYMLWMAKKLAESSTLPAFIFPQYASEWNSSLTQPSFTKLVEENPFERKYSILGGGDVGIPLLLISSAYFGYGFISAVVVAVFSVLGLICSYWIQAALLKGKPTPALPPIAILSLIALIIVRYF
ncbi:MAG: presenilin family intramembrane aspartyl protease [Dehalococcoidales bacterium]|nr:presenilin family intramembrane aspartyl protease [Dehalococcoidales bacterium]MDP7310399.1 presenilin family intramembrane aspartyl protease [Dehalococcoidales bacterium]MDP7676296.1 presenilin family intramembrane aspartyl protease [Dehalococcoidales bacterium]